MTGIHVYEAPFGEALDGFVRTTGEPGEERFISVIARPSARSLHPLAADVMRSFGAVRDLYTKAQGMSALLLSATAWSLARGLTDLYIGEAQDLEAHLDECVEFAHGAGLDLHLVYGFGQVHVHGPALIERGAGYHDFNTLPGALRARESRRELQAVEDTDAGDDPLPAPPDEPWMTFRAIYTDVLDPEQAGRCDEVYLAAYTLGRDSTATDKEGVSRLLGEAWSACGTDDASRLIALRAVQAALFRNGFNMHADMRQTTRYVMENYVTALVDAHYAQMHSFADPWRAAATVLHAHHMTIPDMLSLRARDVSTDGRIEGFDAEVPRSGREIILAQRWRRLLEGDANPPLFRAKELMVRAGIRAFATELELPVSTNWRIQNAGRWDQRHGLRIKAIS